MDLGGWRAAGLTGKRPKGKPSSGWDRGWQIRAEGMSPRHQDSMQWLLTLRTKELLHWPVSPNSVVLGQSLLNEKPTAHVWDMLIKSLIKRKVPRQQSSVKVSSCSREFPQLTSNCEHTLCQAGWTVKRSQNLPGTQVRIRGRRRTNYI